MENEQKLILIIDDDNDLREVLATKLQSSGFKVEQAPDGPSGIKKAGEIVPDLILLDVRMPGMTGIEVLSKMKNEKELSGVRVIFLTNLGEAEDANAWIDEKFAKDAGAIGHIRKTDDLDKILARVKQELLNGTS